MHLLGLPQDLRDGVAHLDRTVQPLKAPPDLFLSFPGAAGAPRRAIRPAVRMSVACPEVILTTPRWHCDSSCV